MSHCLFIVIGGIDMIVNFTCINTDGFSRIREQITDIKGFESIKIYLVLKSCFWRLLINMIMYLTTLIIDLIMI